MSKMMLLCEKITANKLLRNFFENEGFTFTNILDIIVCRVCEFQTRATLTISHIQFMHRLFNPECEMVSYCHKYENYGVCKLILSIDTYSSVKNLVLETERIMTQTFRSWPKRLPRVEQLVSAGFFYTGVSDDVSCVECKVVLHKWKDTDEPWIEHEKASPDCILIKLYNKRLL